MKRASMAMNAEGKGKSDGCCCSAPCSCEEDRPRYPWGLQLAIEKDQLEALGIKELPKVGSTMMIECMVKVTGCNEEEREGGEPDRRVSLQIVEMGIDGAPLSDKEKAATMYGKSKTMEGM